jgi:hypothetical protein
MRIITPSEPVGKKTPSEQALAEFKVAVDIWFARMDNTEMLAATNYASETAGTIRGKQPCARLTPTK